MGVSAVLSPDFRSQGVLSPEIPQNGRMRIETTARPEQNQGEHRNQKRARKSSIVGGPAGPKIEDWSSIGAWKATGKSSQYAGGCGGVRGAESRFLTRKVAESRNIPYDRGDSSKWFDG